MVMCFSAPFEFRNSRETLTMVLPFQCMVRYGFSVTVATTVDSRFSSAASSWNRATSFGSTTTAIRS